MRGRPLIAIAALPLAACGGSKSSAPSPAPLGAIKSAADKTARTSMHAKLTGTASSSVGNLDLSGSGDFDNARHLGSLHLQAGVAGTNIAIDEVFEGTTFYMKLPSLARTLPAGKTWIKLDLQRVGKAFGIDFSELMSNPSQSLTQMQAVNRATNLGAEQIDGVQTTRYRVHLDPSKLLQGARIEALTHATYEPEDIWVDKAGYVRRVRFAYSVRLANSARQRQSMTMDFSNFGEPVSAKPPPAAQVVDATNLSLKGLTGG